EPRGPRRASPGAGRASRCAGKAAADPRPPPGLLAQAPPGAVGADPPRLRPSAAPRGGGAPRAARPAEEEGSQPALDLLDQRDRVVADRGEVQVGDAGRAER